MYEIGNIYPARTPDVVLEKKYKHIISLPKKTSGKLYELELKTLIQSTKKKKTHIKDWAPTLWNQAVEEILDY